MLRSFPKGIQNCFSGSQCISYNSKKESPYFSVVPTSIPLLLMWVDWCVLVALSVTLTRNVRTVGEIRQSEFLELQLEVLSQNLFVRMKRDVCSRKFRLL